jgi:glycosyltransferase involved in cell wall biosynthesis
MFLPNGLDLEEFSPGDEEQKVALRRKYNLPEDKVLALFVGRFVPKKGFSKLFDLPASENLELVFVGGFAPRGHSRDDQHFLGVIASDNMPDIYRLSDVFVLPSQGEGFPVTAQEAMACGLPVVMTNDPAYNLYDLDHSLVRLVEPTVKAVSATLESMASDPELRQAMGAYSRRYALKNFNQDTKIAELIDMYRFHLAGR